MPKSLKPSKSLASCTGKSSTALKYENTRHWLIKGEGESRFEKGKDVKFSLEDLEKGASCWDGVRNYEARNIMRDCMKTTDLCFFYHSNWYMGCSNSQ